MSFNIISKVLYWLQRNFKSALNSQKEYIDPRLLNNLYTYFKGATVCRHVKHIYFLPRFPKSDMSSDLGLRSSISSSKSIHVWMRLLEDNFSGMALQITVLLQPRTRRFKKQSIYLTHTQLSTNQRWEGITVYILFQG